MLQADINIASLMRLCGKLYCGLSHLLFAGPVRYRSIASYIADDRDLCPPHLHSTPPLGGFMSEYCCDVWYLRKFHYSSILNGNGRTAMNTKNKTRRVIVASCPCQLGHRIKDYTVSYRQRSRRSRCGYSCSKNRVTLLLCPPPATSSSPIRHRRM